MAKIAGEWPLFVRHSRESGNPSPNDASGGQAGRWIPACAEDDKMGWKQGMASPFQGGVGVGCERSELLPYRR